MNCPNCGSFIADGAAICPSCGSIVAQQGYQQPNFQQQGYPNMGYQQPNFQQQGYPNMGYQQPNFQQQGHPNMGYQQPVQPTYKVPKKKLRVVPIIIGIIVLLSLAAGIYAPTYLKKISKPSGTYEFYSMDVHSGSIDKDTLEEYGVSGYIKFKSDNKCTFFIDWGDLDTPDVDGEFTYELDGDVITFSYNETEASGTYDKDDETITITYENGTRITFKK